MRLFTSLLMTVLFVAAGTSSAAGADTSTGDRVLVVDANGQRPVGTLLEQGRALARTLATRSAAASFVQVQNSNASGGRSKKWLTIGLIGVGTAVAGIFVYEKEEFNLPGLVSGREIAGQTMMLGGAVFGGLGLWKAFSSD